MRMQEARVRLAPPTLPEMKPFEVPTLTKAETTAFVANDIEEGVEYVHSETAGGLTLNTYRRFPNPLVKLHKRNGLPAASYMAGLAYRDLYLRAWGDRSGLSNADPTRIVVQSSPRDFTPPEGHKPSQNELDRLQATLFGKDTRNLLDAVCGREQSIRGYAIENQRDRKACKERLFAALAKYADYRKVRK